MKVGIVGHEAAKFTSEREALARTAIRAQLHSGDVVVSGQCHLGGIDIWAVEEAYALGLKAIEYPPSVRNWAQGFKPRNIQIARASDRIVCIVVKQLPEGYQGDRFPFCYHCNTDSHIKSGGCWTGKYAAQLGKPFELVVIP